MRAVWLLSSLIVARATEGTSSPTPSPTTTHSPTSPTHSPTSSPTASPTSPTLSPTVSPTYSPTESPTYSPTLSPTLSPTSSPTHSPSQSPTSSPSVQPTTSAGFAYPCPDPSLGGPNCDAPLVQLLNVSRSEFVNDTVTYFTLPHFRYQATAQQSVGGWSFWEWKAPKNGPDVYGGPPNSAREEYLKYFRLTSSGGQAVASNIFASRTCIHAQSSHCRARDVFPAQGNESIVNVSGFLPFRAFVSPMRGINVSAPISMPWAYRPLNYGCGCENVGTLSQVDYEEVWYFAVQHGTTSDVTLTIDVEPVCSGNGVMFLNYSWPYCQCNSNYINDNCWYDATKYEAPCCEDYLNVLPALTSTMGFGSLDLNLSYYAGTTRATYFVLPMRPETVGSWTVQYTLQTSSQAERNVTIYQVRGQSYCEPLSLYCEYVNPKIIEDVVSSTYTHRNGFIDQPGCDCSHDNFGANRELIRMKIYHVGINRAAVNLRLGWTPRCDPAQRFIWNYSFTRCSCDCAPGWERATPNTCGPCSVQVVRSGESDNINGSALGVSNHILFPDTTLTLLPFYVPPDLVPGNDFQLIWKNTSPFDGSIRFRVFKDCRYVGANSSAYDWWDVSKIQAATLNYAAQFAAIPTAGYVQNGTWSFSYRDREFSGYVFATRDLCRLHPGQREERYTFIISSTSAYYPTNFTLITKIVPFCEARCLNNTQTCVRNISRSWPSGIANQTKMSNDTFPSVCVCPPNKIGANCALDVYSDSRLLAEGRTQDFDGRLKYHSKDVLVTLPGFAPHFGHIMTSATNEKVTISVGISSVDLPFTLPPFPPPVVHIWAAYDDMTLMPPGLASFPVTQTNGTYRFSLDTSLPSNVKFSTKNDNITSGESKTSLEVPASAGELYYVIWFDNIYVTPGVVAGRRYDRGYNPSADQTIHLSVEIEDTVGKIVGFVLVSLSILVLLIVFVKFCRKFIGQNANFTLALFQFLNIAGDDAQFAGVRNNGGVPTGGKWKSAKYFIWVLALIQILLDIGGALSMLAFNLAILHKQLRIVVSLPAMDALLDAFQTAVGAMAWIIVPLTRFLADILDSIELKNTLNWNCGGALATMTPLLLLICTFILMMIIQKHIVFRVAITLQGNGGFARKATARFLQAFFLSVIQSIVILVLVLINFSGEDKLFCGEGDKNLQESMSTFTVVVVAIIVPPLFMVFGMVKKDADSLSNIFWAVGRICLITVGIWSKRVVDSFEIPQIAEFFDNDPTDNDNQQEAVMLLFAQTRCLLWCLIPGGVVATKLAEASNSNVILVEKGARLKLKRPWPVRAVGWCMSMLQFALTLHFVSSNDQKTGEFLLALTILMPIVHALMGEGFIALVKKLLAMRAGSVASPAAVPL